MPAGMTELDVVNEALHNLQESPISDLNAEGKIPETMKFLLPIARRNVLEMADYVVSRKRAPLEKITEESPGVPVINYSGRAYVYSVPADALRILEVLDPVTMEQTDWVREGIRIYTDTDEAIGVYTIDLPDPATWDDLLATSIATMLASKAAFTITGEKSREQELFQLAAAYMAGAKKQSYSQARKPFGPSDQWAPGLFDVETRR